MNQSQKLKDMAIQLLIILRDMGDLSQEDLKDISTMIDSRYKKARNKDYESVFS